MEKMTEKSNVKEIDKIENNNGDLNKNNSK